MSLGVVSVVVDRLPAHPELLRETLAAVAAQERAPQHVLERGAAAGLEAARATGADWIWLLDGITVPAPGALAAFEDGLERLAGLPEPLVLAGRVLTADGTMHPDALPRHELFEKELSVAACARGLVHLRAASSGSVLVRRRVLDRFAAPRTDLPPSWAIFELTARVLQSWGDPGYLVPDSVAVRRVPPRPAGRAGGALRTRARLLGSSAWTTTERLWETYILAEATIRAAREPALPA